LTLIVEELPHYARFECPDGDATLSVERRAGSTTENRLPCTSNAPISIKRSRSYSSTAWRWRRSEGSALAVTRSVLERSGRERELPIYGWTEPEISAAGGARRGALAAGDKRVVAIARGSVRGAPPRGKVLGETILNDYTSALSEIRSTGFTIYWPQEFRPYLRGAAEQFTREHELLTQRFLRCRD
jgi:hypothetical protein